MSCRLSHRLTNVHCAVSIALICSGSATLISNVQAATIGKTVITSAQHQPLTVRLNVTDIGGSDFSVSLANADIYQKMGLTPNPLMTVNFQPTSANSGDIYISTAEPVSKPFADVVLSIRDKGQRTIIPKTLLMPLDDSLPVNVNTTKNTKRSADSNRNSQPLSVRNGTPPPLLSAPNLSDQHSSMNEALIAKSAANNAPAHAAPVKSPASAATSTPISASNIGNHQADNTSRFDNGHLGTSKAQPLSVRNGAPPPLLSAPNLSDQHSSMNEALIAKSAANNAPAHAAPVKSPASAATSTPISASNIGNHQADNTSRFDNGHLGTSKAQPLSVRNGAPPPLLSAPNLSDQHSSMNEALIAKSAANNAPAHAAPVKSPASAATSTPISASNIGNHQADNTSRLDNGRLGKSIVAKSTGHGFDINENHRQSMKRLDDGRLHDIVTSNTVIDNVVYKASSASKTASLDHNPTSSKSVLITALADSPSENLNIQVTRLIKSNTNKYTEMASPLVPITNDSNLVTAAANLDNNPASDTTLDSYQVQRNDSLWSISRIIAQENNLVASALDMYETS